jgi:hypothetical protein
MFKLLASLKADRSNLLNLSRLEKKYTSKTDFDGIEPKIRPADRRKIIHEVAMGIFDHAESHSDASILKRLFNHIEDDEREAIREWLTTYGGLYTKQNGNFGWKTSKSVNRTAALNNPFWTFLKKPGKPARTFNFSDELVRLVGKATERALKPKPGDMIDLALLADVKRLIVGR